MGKENVMGTVYGGIKTGSAVQVTGKLTPHRCPVCGGTGVVWG